MLYSILSNLAMIIAKLLFRLEIKGSENVPLSGGFILASNHSSYLDPVILGACCPRKLNFMARHDLFTVPILGALIRNVGAFPVRRGSANIGSLKESIQRLKHSAGLLVFPEGSRSLGGEVKKVEPGIGYIAAKSRTPVVPVFVKGTDRAWGRNARFIRLTKIKVYFGRPFYPDNCRIREDYEDFARRVMKEINQLSQD